MVLGLIGNMSVGETLLIAVLAILVFGRRLPQVAGQVAGQLMRARRALTDLRRETGIDDELRKARNSVRSWEQARPTTWEAPPPPTGPSVGPPGPPEPRSPVPPEQSEKAEGPDRP